MFCLSSKAAAFVPGNSQAGVAPKPAADIVTPAAEAKDSGSVSGASQQFLKELSSRLKSSPQMDTGRELPGIIDSILMKKEYRPLRDIPIQKEISAAEKQAIADFLRPPAYTGPSEAELMEILEKRENTRSQYRSGYFKARDGRNVHQQYNNGQGQGNPSRGRGRGR